MGKKNIEIIPAINETNFNEIASKIRLIEFFFTSLGGFTPPGGADWVQIDVADGTFTKNTTWHNPSDLLSFQTTLNIEVHLMIDNIEKRIESWLLPNIKRIVFHLSASNDPELVMDKIRSAGKEVGVAVGPDESIIKALSFNHKIDMYQILCVNPGLAGQKAQEKSFQQIKEMREFCQSCIIEVDGGMNKEMAKRAVEAGADIIVAASTIFKDNNIKENIEELKNAFKR